MLALVKQKSPDGSFGKASTNTAWAEKKKTGEGESVKSSSCSQECLGECVCDILSISHTYMQTQPLNSLFLCFQLVRCEAAQIPRLHDHRADPEQTLSLIKVYKLGLNATVACGLSKLCVCTVNAHSCLLCTGYPGEKAYQVFFQVRVQISTKKQKWRNQKLQDNMKIIFAPVTAALVLMLCPVSHEKGGQESGTAGICK